MEQLYIDLITNISHMKCIVKMSEIEVEKYITETTKDTNELVASFEETNKAMRKYLDEITLILHKILG